MDIFNLIEKKSHNIAKKIGNGDTEEDIELYEYSIFMILSNIFTIGIGLLFSKRWGEKIFNLLLSPILDHKI